MHTKLLACTGTFPCTLPTLLTPTHVFPWWVWGQEFLRALCASSTTVAKSEGNFQLQSCNWQI